MFFISITFIKQKRRQSVTIYFVDILYKNCNKFYLEQSYFILKLILSNATVHYTNNKSNKKKNTVTFSLFRTVTFGENTLQTNGKYFIYDTV